jgi:hypothetical protein
MITFTKNIELFEIDDTKNFEIFIGTIPNRYGLSVKIVKTSNDVKFSHDLINEKTGKVEGGRYLDRTIYNFAFRQAPDKFHWIRSTTKVRKPI